MAFFKKQRINGKWYARAVNMGKPATIDDVANRLARRSTVSRSDTYAVLVDLGEVLGEIMAEGRTVKLKGVGTFYLTCQTKGKGTDTPEELTADQITDVKVRFIPEYNRNHQRKVTRRTMMPERVEWYEVADTEGKTVNSTPSDEDTATTGGQPEA